MVVKYYEEEVCTPHSLIWRDFVCRVAVNDYSRLTTLLQCSTNNKAEAVITLLDYPLETFSLLATGRTDKGGEITSIQRKNIEFRGLGISIEASSVNNQLIKRNYDFWNHVCSQFNFFSSYGSRRLV